MLRLNTIGAKRAWLLLLMVLPLACRTPAPEKNQKKGSQMELTSPAFRMGDFIPARYSCEGEDFSPPLQWQGVPEGTRSFALTCVDPDAPMGDWVHWVIWDIPGDSRSLPENIASREQILFRQGVNSWGRLGYGGPCPPPGHGAHRYFFTLYALDIPQLSLESNTDRAALEKTIQGHILAQAQLMGRYERK